MIDRVAKELRAEGMGDHPGYSRVLDRLVGVVVPWAVAEQLARDEQIAWLELGCAAQNHILEEVPPAPFGFLDVLHRRNRIDPGAITKHPDAAFSHHRHRTSRFIEFVTVLGHRSANRRPPMLRP